MNTRNTTALANRLHTSALHGVHFAFNALIKPKSASEDDRRREFILNIILLFTLLIGLVFLAFLIVKISLVKGDYQGIPIAGFSLFLASFGGLLAASRFGYFRNSAYILTTLYFGISTYCIWRWGVELPLAGFSYVITIAVASILINTRFGFITTGIITLTLTAIGWMQVNGLAFPDLYWKYEDIILNDPLQLSLALMLVMTIAWLSNREIERSLSRARKSEQELLYERDQLEIKVEERTRELKEMQMEKISNLYRFAEFGKLSSGLFHDLMNPLMSVVNNVSQLERSPEHLPEVQDHLDRAISASKRIGEYLSIIRKQIKVEESEQTFSLNKELKEAIDILQYRAREVGVRLNLFHKAEVITYGHAIKFYQVALNLLSNGIDACQGVQAPKNRTVKSVINQKGSYVVIIVSDSGAGILPEHLDKIFDPFFSTKEATRGMGLGLSSTKSIIEKHFNGTISVKSTPNKGSVFTVRFPVVIP